jgi:thiosulfate dehydrogenase
MKYFILGIIVTLVCIAAGVVIYFAGGFAPVATSAQAMPFEKHLANMALEAYVEKQAPKTVPIPWDEANLTAGAKIYKDDCAVCHGLPEQKDVTPVAKGMFPKPPQLFKGHGVTDDPPGETYWKIANGIRLTGMPAFKPSLSETQMWQVSLVLANADKLPPSAQQVLGGQLSPQGAAHQHDQH